MTDAKNANVQSGIESSLVLNATLTEDADIAVHVAGLLDTFNIASYEKFLIDQQTVTMIQM